jgi:hypothetical protein
MAADNATILAKVWLNGTNDFQQRIPDPTQHGIDATMDALFDPMNKAYYNQFVDSLIMRIGYTYVNQQSFSNPLKAFKKNKLMYGNSVQEMIPKWIRAHSYVDDAEDVFKMARPDVATWYHSQNRRDRYDITINEQELRTAFTDSYGLNKLVAAFMNTPMNADEYDEYRIMLQLLAFYDNKWGFFKHHLSAAPTDEATGKEFLTAVRSYAGKLRFPNTIYNCKAIEDVPVFVKPSELVLLLTPDTQAAIDVNTLASVFQLDKADIKYRTVEVDEFPMPNVVAILTTEDFFQCYDTVYETTSMYNPKTLGTNYFLHHWGIYSVSPFVPAIAFTTDAATSVTTVNQTVTGITATIDNATPDLGESTAIHAKLTGTLSPAGVDGIEVAPNAATYDVTVTRKSGSGTVPVNSPATRVDEYGVLHVSNKLQYGDVINVAVKSTYVNPSGATTPRTASVTATVTKKGA